MVLALVVPLDTPLAALGVPVGDKGTPARAAKSCQRATTVCPRPSKYKPSSCASNLFSSIFTFSSFRVFKFSGFQVLTLDMGPGKIRDQSDAFSGFQIFKFRHLEDVRFPLDRFTAFRE